MKRVVIAILMAWLLVTAADGQAQPAARRLRLGVVQMSLADSVVANRDRIIDWIEAAAAKQLRVVVFPEDALGGYGNDRQAVIDEAVAAIGVAARKHQVYVICGVARQPSQAKRHLNSMFVLGPDGTELFSYNKLYDDHRARMPGVFFLDGVPASTMICADRWLRGIEEIPIQQGAKISFELSCNFASEWVEPFQWYWYVPRALRNNAWVVFANSGNRASGISDSGDPRQLRHGHCAIISPDGQLVAAAHDDVETIVVAEIDVEQATRREALSRSSHPVLRPFWQAGLKLHSGQSVSAPPLVPMATSSTDVTLAAAQVGGSMAEIESMIARAGREGADLVALAERAVEESDLPQLQAAARRHRITVVAGSEHHDGPRRYNSAFVVGPDGDVLTRYDQLAASGPYQPGKNAGAMWFSVKGVPAVVTIGRDALWSELAELAAVAGARLQVHIDRDPLDTAEARLRRLQIWANMASFQTFTVAANVTGSTIWDDLGDLEERRAEVQGMPRPKTGRAEVYSPFSANLVVQAGDEPGLIVATRHIGKRNEYYPRRTANFNPQMDPWYRLGAAVVHPNNGKDR